MPDTDREVAKLDVGACRGDCPVQANATRRSMARLIPERRIILMFYTAHDPWVPHHWGLPYGRHPVPRSRPPPPDAEPPELPFEEAPRFGRFSVIESAPVSPPPHCQETSDSGCRGVRGILKVRRQSNSLDEWETRKPAGHSAGSSFA